MKTFSDNAGRTWTVQIHVAALRRIKTMVGVDLNTLLDGGDLLKRLMSDPVLVCEVMHAVVRPEAEAKGISEDDFFGAMAGDVIEAAREALLAEVVGFTPNSRDRARIARILGKTERWYATARDAMDARVELGDAVFAKAFAEAMAEADAAMNSLASSPGESSTSAPESAESIPVL